MEARRSRTWVWQFDRPVADVWPVLGDTARFNEAARLPRHHIEETPQPDGSVLYIGRARIGPMKLAWREQPVNWVHEQWFEHCRHFLSGPLLLLCARLVVVPEGDGCRVEYTAEAEARNLLGRCLLNSVFFWQIGRTFEPLAENAAHYVRGERETEFDVPPPRLATGARERATEMVGRIGATPHGHGLASRLADYVLRRQDVDLWSIRPLKLARLWRVPEREAIEVCLEAVKQGLLRIRWDLLCPRCQVAKISALALDELPTGAHCDTCNIDYGRDYTDNIELAFQPANSIRPVETGEYCLFGPMSTPHIKIHLTVPAGKHRTVTLRLGPGRYRLRTLEAGAELSFEYDGGGFPTLHMKEDSAELGDTAGGDAVELHNDGPRTLTIILEEKTWARDALTAKRATSLQAFRDLFNEDTLRPGDHVELDYVAIMFTDLKGSTALYERIGDPEAYALVREHFAILGKAVREHDGAVVKTIGDAIMASFNDPRNAFDCAVQIQDDFALYNQDPSHEPAIIKLGLHVGRCIAVTLNNRLDYYGTAANKAARLEGQSEGGDIVMSPEFADDPPVRGALTDYEVRRETAALKGLGDSIDFLRIPAECLNALRR